MPRDQAKSGINYRVPTTTRGEKIVSIHLNPKMERLYELEGIIERMKKNILCTPLGSSERAQLRCETAKFMKQYKVAYSVLG